MADIGILFLGKKYANPVFLASGILGETGPTLVRCHKAGAGCVVTKSVGKEEQKGNPNPVYLSTSHYTLNCMGLPNPGIDEYVNELSFLRENNVPFGGSVFADNPRDFAHLCGKMEEYGARFIELNISCPNKEGVGDVISQDQDLTRKIVVESSGAVDIPVLPKLPPNLADPGTYASVLASSGASGFVCCNTMRGVHIDVGLGKAVLSRKFGGVAGPALKPVSLYSVWKVYEETEMPIIGVGGIAAGNDVAEYMMAGASAVEIGSVIEEDRPGAFLRIAEELKSFLEREGHASPEEVVGIAHC